MMLKSRKSIQILSKYGKAIMLVAIAGIGIHTAVLMLDFYIIKKALYVNFENDFTGTAFSFPMIPMIGAYVILTMIAYSLWLKMKNALLASQEKEIHIEKEKIALESMQRIVGLYASCITSHNTEILKWVETRKQINKKVPEEVELAARSISAALETFSEIAFIAPYSKSDSERYLPSDIESIEKLVRKKVEMLNTINADDNSQ